MLKFFQSNNCCSPLRGRQCRAEPVAPATCRRSASLRGNKSLEPNDTACKRTIARPKPGAIASARQLAGCAIHELDAL